MNSTDTPNNEQSESLVNDDCQILKESKSINDINISSELKNDNFQNDKMVIKLRSIICNIIVPFSLLFYSLFFIFFFFDIFISFYFLIMGITFILIVLYHNKYKIELIKDIPNRKLYIIIKNYFLCNKKKLYLNQDNIHFNIYYRFSSDLKGTLYIINNLKDLLDIDLNISKIKEKPAEIFYDFDILYDKKKANKYSNDLNNFIDSPNNYQNPFSFNIQTYMKKNSNDKKPLTNSSPEYNSYGPSKIMKFNEHYFTYCFSTTHPRFLYICEHYCVCPIFIDILFIFASTVVFCLVNKIIVKLILIFVLIIYNLILFSVYKCIRFCKSEDIRIDFIYSKNFDKIFIGVVQENEKYRITLEYEMKNIDNFYIEGSNEDTYLKVLFKNKKSDYVYCLKFMTKENSEGLIYLLNEKLKLININNNINNINHIDNDITP